MKSDKGKKANVKLVKKTAAHADEKLISKSKKNLKEEDDDFEDDEIKTTSLARKNGKPASPKKGKEMDDDEEEIDDVKDDWEKPEAEEDWDPDFDEFDIPKSKGSKGKKVAGGAKKADEDDLKLDDEFKEMDLFDDRFDDDGEDDDY